MQHMQGHDVLQTAPRAPGTTNEPIWIPGACPVGTYAIRQRQRVGLLGRHDVVKGAAARKRSRGSARLWVGGPDPLSEGSFLKQSSSGHLPSWHSCDMIAYHRLSASSSASLAETQEASAPICSFFQNGARDLR